MPCSCSACSAVQACASSTMCWTDYALLAPMVARKHMPAAQPSVLFMAHHSLYLQGRAGEKVRGASVLMLQA